ncbi:MAG: hypothetical protein JW751_10015 [Polyangiaceae bacterium]|nr:hypothetical protein [Polyangiaceae bacterium]
MTLRGATAILALALEVACSRHEMRDDFPGPTARAEFGVYYGGQVQERERIPLEHDRTRQTQGVRLWFDGPLAKDIVVSWEIDMPGNTRGVRDVHGRVGRGRLQKLDEFRVPAGRSRFDQELVFRPSDPLGTWNIRVRVDGEIVIDRPFEVVKP